MNIVHTAIDEHQHIPEVGQTPSTLTQDTCVQKKGIPRWVVLTIASILLVIVINAKPLGRLLRLLICRMKERFGCSMPDADARHIVTQNDDELKHGEFCDGYELNEFINEQFMYDNASMPRARSNTTSPSVVELHEHRQDDIGDVLDELEPVLEGVQPLDELEPVLEGAQPRRVPRRTPAQPPPCPKRTPTWATDLVPEDPPEDKPENPPEDKPENPPEDPPEDLPEQPPVQQEQEVHQPEVRQDNVIQEHRAEVHEEPEPEPERVPKKRQGRKKKE